MCWGRARARGDRRRGRRVCNRRKGVGRGFGWYSLGRRKAGGKAAFAVESGSGRKVGGGAGAWREWRVDRERAARDRARERGGAKVKSAFADQSPDGRRLGASGDGCVAVLGLRAFHRRRGERRRTARSLRAFVHRRGGSEGKRQSRQERAVIEQRMTTRLPARGFFLRRFVRGTLPFLGSGGIRFRRRAGKRVEHGPEGERVGCRLRSGARRGRRDWPGRRLRRRAWSWRAFSLGWRREARRALKRFLRLRDRQRGPAGLTLVGVGQSDGVFRIEDTLVGNDTELRRHPSSRGQQAGVSPVEFCRRQSPQIG